MDGTVILWLLFALIPSAIASGKGRSGPGWFLFGLVAPILAIILVLILPNLKDQAEFEADLTRENRRLREELIQERIRNADHRAQTAARLHVHDQALGLDTRSLDSLESGSRHGIGDSHPEPSSENDVLGEPENLESDDSNEPDMR